MLLSGSCCRLPPLIPDLPAIFGHRQRARNSRGCGNDEASEHASFKLCRLANHGLLHLWRLGKSKRESAFNIGCIEAAYRSKSWESNSANRVSAEVIGR